MNMDKKLKELEKQGFLIPSPVMIKSKEEIEGIKKASKVNTGLLDYLGEHLERGMSSEDIDDLAMYYLHRHGAQSGDYHYEGFPKSICTSINDVVCHGIPNPYDILKNGDIINVDATTLVDGYYGDASRMYMIGHVSRKARRLVEVSKECLYKGIESIKPYRSTIGDIGKAIERHAHANGYSVVEEFCGHGIGKSMHEDPLVYHYDPGIKTEVLVPGMVITIEPMINQGSKEVCLEEGDDWSVYTWDGSLSAQWEHTVLVTEEGVEILSR